MARGTLHPAKDEASRRRRNKPTHDETPLPRDDKVRGPGIEEATGKAIEDYHQLTIRWWNTWRNSPQAAVFEDTDWMRLAVLAAIMDGYVRRPSAAALSEIRLNEERLGATVVDRMRARMRIDDEPAADAPLAPVTAITSRADIASRLQS